MLKRLLLRNFQKHRNLDLNFTSGLNVIIGSSDSGKSAVFRALNWLRYNRPTIGIEKFKSWGSKENENMSVTAEFDNCTIKRERGKSSNFYQINSDEPLDKIKTDVPYDVENLINMNYINFQRQDQGYSFLQDSPGEAANKIGEIVEMSIISDVIKNLNRYLLEAKRGRDFADKKVLEIDSELNDLPSPSKIAKVKDMLNRLENAEKKKREKENELLLILESEARINELREREEDLEFWTSYKEIVEKINFYFVNLDNYQNKNYSLKNSLDKIYELRKKEKNLKNILKYKEKVEKVLSLIKKLEKITSISTEIEKSTARGAKFRFVAIDLEDKRTKAIEEYSKLLRNNKICPTCFVQIEEKEIEKIIESLEGKQNILC